MGKECVYMNKFKKFFYSQKAAPYVFVLPFIVSFAFFWIYPLFSTITMSFQDIKPTGAEWVGLKNFSKLLKDTVFHTAILNSFEYMALTLVLLIPFPMLFAVLMDSRLVKAKGFWKACLYVPALTSVVISGTLFRLMFSEYPTGQMNMITAALGLGTFKWLKMKATGLTALLIVCCWRWTGVNMLYFISGLKAIDTSLYESAEIDGASAWQKFKDITLPELKPLCVFVFITVTIGAFRMIVQPMVMTGGGPSNSTYTIVYDIYETGTGNWEIGLASAMAVLFVIFVVVLTIIQNVLTRDKESKNENKK